MIALNALSAWQFAAYVGLSGQTTLPEELALTAERKSSPEELFVHLTAWSPALPQTLAQSVEATLTDWLFA